MTTKATEELMDFKELDAELRIWEQWVISHAYGIQEVEDQGAKPWRLDQIHNKILDAYERMFAEKIGDTHRRMTYYRVHQGMGKQAGSDDPKTIRELAIQIIKDRT